MFSLLKGFPKKFIILKAAKEFELNNGMKDLAGVFLLVLFVCARKRFQVALVKWFRFIHVLSFSALNNFSSTLSCVASEKT